MRRWLLILALAGAVAGASACGGDPAAIPTQAPPPTAPISTPEPVTTASATPAPTAPVLHAEELEGFEQRSVVYANVEFTVTGARLTNQELSSYFEGADPVVEEGAVYAILDITASNLMTSSLGELSEELYSLGIDGESFDPDPSMSFRSEASRLLQPTTTVDTALAFPVPEDVDFGAAVLLIGAAPDRGAQLPLTGPVDEPAYPIEIAADGSAPGIGPTNAGDLVFTVLGAVLSEDRPHEHATSPTGDRADEGELFLVVTVRAEKTDGRGRELLSDAFRLLVDGVPRAPWDVADSPEGSVSTPSVDLGAAVDAYVAFLIPEDATDLVLQVGDVEADPGLIPLDVASAG
ncbi:MAG TPA: hypothetical protein VML96_04345 [Egibacteraceae bacterium]|nr:hypothetical protein [Egibacteraceae bacterium]